MTSNSGDWKANKMAIASSARWWQPICTLASQNSACSPHQFASIRLMPRETERVWEQQGVYLPMPGSVSMITFFGEISAIWKAYGCKSATRSGWEDQKKKHEWGIEKTLVLAFVHKRLRWDNRHISTSRLNIKMLIPYNRRNLSNAKAENLSFLSKKIADRIAVTSTHKRCSSSKSSQQVITLVTSGFPCSNSPWLQQQKLRLIRASAAESVHRKPTTTAIAHWICADAIVRSLANCCASFFAALRSARKEKEEPLKEHLKESK